MAHVAGRGPDWTILLELRLDLLRLEDPRLAASVVHRQPIDLVLTNDVNKAVLEALERSSMHPPLHLGCAAVCRAMRVKHAIAKRKNASPSPGSGASCQP